MLLDTIRMLEKVTDFVEFVPLTTRDDNDYSHVNLPIGTPHYALINNGCTLLVDGEEDITWAKESRNLARDSLMEMHRLKSVFLDSLTFVAKVFSLNYVIL